MKAPPFDALRSPLVLAWRDGHLALGADPAAFDSAPVVAVVDAAAGAGAPVAPLRAGPPRRRVQLLVGDEHARLFHLERPRGARSPGELEGALRLRMQQLFGD